MTGAPDIRYARNGDVHIAFTTVGTGPDLVIAPGFIAHQEVGWEEPSVVHFYERLASFRRVISFDQRGGGLSDPISHPPTLEECVDDLGAVMAAVGSERADLLGISEGGAMAAMFAAIHPDRVRSLVLYGSFARLLAADDYPCGVCDEDMAKLLEISDRGWGEGVGLGAWAPSRRDDARLRQWWARLQRLAATPGMVRGIFALYPDIDFRHVLPTIQAPTLVLHRRDDRMVNLGMGRYLADHIPGARLVELEGTDHLFFTGDADTILDEVEEFLTGVRHTSEPDRVLATVLFTDVVGSTERAVQVGDTRWREFLDAHHAQVRRQLERFRGREVKTTGDGFVAVFDGPARTIRCAIAIRDAVRGLGSRSVRACTRESSRLWATTSPVSPSTWPLASAAAQTRATCGYRAPSSTSSLARDWSSRTAGPTNSRVFPTRGSCSRSRPKPSLQGDRVGPLPEAGVPGGRRACSCRPER